MKLSGFLSLLLSASAVLPVPFQDTSAIYDNVKVLRIPTGNITSKLDSLVSKYELNVWTVHTRPNSHLDVEVSAEKYSDFTTAVSGILKEDGITVPIITMHEDLGARIRQESEGIFSASELVTQAGAFASSSWFNSYHPYADHLTFLDDLITQFPKNAKIVSSGKSVQGRDIKGIHICGSSCSGSKPAIIWHSTVHAREWIATMVNEYLAYNLLTEYNNSTQVRSFVDNYDFYIFPIFNPDGFVYSQTMDRLWRKNRQQPPSGTTCYGRDINKNWDVQWSTPGGASIDPCAQNYKGQAPADAPETAALASFVNTLVKSAACSSIGTLTINFSSYGYDCAKAAADNSELSQLASGFTSAVGKVHGTSFDSGPICTTIYAVTGGSSDYTYDVAKIKYSFTAELRDTGSNGFVLPPAQIRPSSEEIWAGVKYLLANIR